MPVLIDVESNLSAEVAGGKVNLTCHVIGHPLPVVEWFKEDEMLNTNDTRLFVDTVGEADGVSVLATLRIDNLQREDNGTYVCEGSNEFTNATASQDLLVQGIGFQLFSKIKSNGVKITRVHRIQKLISISTAFLGAKQRK